MTAAEEIIARYRAAIEDVETLLNSKVQDDGQQEMCICDTKEGLVTLNLTLGKYTMTNSNHQGNKMVFGEIGPLITQLQKVYVVEEN